jgi:hypothetical protein
MSRHEVIKSSNRQRNNINSFQFKDSGILLRSLQNKILPSCTSEVLRNFHSSWLIFEATFTIPSELITSKQSTYISCVFFICDICGNYGFDKISPVPLWPSRMSPQPAFVNNSLPQNNADISSVL